MMKKLLNYLIKNNNYFNYMNPTFWLSNPSVLLNIHSISDFYPTSNMTFIEKLNNISRLVIVLSLLGYFLTFQWNYIGIGIITLLCIVGVYYYKKNKEGMENKDNNPVVYKQGVKTDLKNVLKDNYQKSTKKNPLANVLLTDIKYKPERKAAQPAFNPTTYDSINENTKKTIQELNPTIKNSSEQLFGNLGDNFEFDQSMWNYYSNPNTKVANDQGAFAQFLYGSMISGKESGIARVQDNIRYLLI
jgi:hypothetical protein